MEAETVESRITELERRVDALVETLGHVIEALGGGEFGQPKKPLEFSSIPGHVEHMGWSGEGFVGKGMNVSAM
jgi:hypothetical protein